MEESIFEKDKQIERYVTCNSTESMDSPISSMEESIFEKNKYVTCNSTESTDSPISSMEESIFEKDKQRERYVTCNSSESVNSTVSSMKESIFEKDKRIIIIKTLFQEGNTISTKLISLEALKYLHICANRQVVQEGRKKCTELCIHIHVNYTHILVMHLHINYTYKLIKHAQIHTATLQTSPHTRTHIDIARHSSSLEACPLGMQAVLSSIPTSGRFFCGDLVMKKFLRPFSLFH